MWSIGEQRAFLALEGGIGPPLLHPPHYPLPTCMAAERSGQDSGREGQQAGTVLFFPRFALQITHLSSYSWDMLADDKHGFLKGDMLILMALNIISGTSIGRAQRMR